MRNFVISLVVATVATLASYGVAVYMGWIATVAAISWLEAFAVWTSYSCTYLCVVQSRINYPIGAITTAAYSYLFYTAGLLSSAALNVYLVPTLLYGWFRWGPDNNTRPITRLAFDKWLLVYGGLIALTYSLLYYVTSLLGATLAPMDSTILILSIFAQFLLDQKKIENWAVWAIVNVVSIYVYFTTGLYLVALQYVFFLGNTVYGWYEWKKSQTNYPKLVEMTE